MFPRLAKRSMLGLPSLSLVAVAACSSAPGGPSSHVGSLSAPLAARAPVAPDAWCAHVVGGARATKDPILSLSAAHASLRYFGGFATQQEVDRALAAAFARPSVDRKLLAAYVKALAPGEACLATPRADALDPAKVTMHGHVAVVRPGTGSVSLPAGTKAVALDLRDLPSVTGLRAALDAAASLALASPVARATVQLRSSLGSVDEVYSFQDYSDQLETSAQSPVPAAAASDLPLAVITGDALAPDAAELAATLRLANRAWLLGADVDVAVAESSFSPVADAGVAWHRIDLLDPVSSAQWPDAVGADEAGDDVATLVAGLESRGAPPAAATSPATRPQLAVWTNVNVPEPQTLGPGEARAGLVIAHGALRLFYPYFAEEGDHIDPKLEESLAAVDALPVAAGTLDRTAYKEIFQRFGHILHDGHLNVEDEANPYNFYIPLSLEPMGGTAVVRHTEIPGLSPGDLLETIDGECAKDWYAREESLMSAATPGWLFQRASEYLLQPNAPRTFGVLTASGEHRTVVATPVNWNNYDGFVFGPSARPSGFLGDLGAPDIYYLNLSQEVTFDDPTALVAIQSAQGARGIIVDMREHPADSDTTLQALIPGSFSSPGFLLPYLQSPAPADYQLLNVTYVDPPATTPPTFYGPLVLLVGSMTMSAGDNQALMFVDAKRPLHVVGRQSAGTDGNITGLELPGGYGFLFTGLKVTHVDGSRYVGIGVLPDIEVPLTQASLAAGDPDLVAAIKSF